jgi:hypothetical protein
MTGSRALVAYGSVAIKNFTNKEVIVAKALSFCKIG